MVIKAFVNKSDYDNMVRTYYLKEDIDADLEVDGTLYKKGEIAFRGTSSLNFPKKGFKIKFRKKKLFQKNTKRFDLSASYVDKSFLRERLSFDLFAKTSVVASKTWPIDFSILSKEGQILERGLYTGIEHVDKYFFRNRQRQIGTLYKADGGAVNGQFMGAVLDPQPEAVLKILYDKKNTKKIVAQGFMVNLFQAAFNLPPIEIAEANEEDYSDLDRFIRNIHSWNASTVAQYLPSVLDVDSYLDWLVVNALVQSNDTYHKNYFLHNRVEDGKWEIIPWDYDLTWGRNWNDSCDGLCDDLSEGTSLKGSAQMTNRLSRLVFSNPTFFERFRVKLADLLANEYTEDKLFEKIDTFYAEIAALAHADTRKWPSNKAFDHERDRLKDWIRRRRRFLYKELGTAPPAEKRADTIVSAVGFNKATPLAGDQLAFEATVHNIGTAATGNTVGVAFLVDGQYVTFGTSAALQPGESRLIKSVSSWPATAGDHTLMAVVDDVNRYPELSETNNTLTKDFHVDARLAPSLSDVVVRDLGYARNESGHITLAALIENLGQTQTGDVVGVAFFVDNQFAAFGVTAPLQAGEKQAVRASQSLPLTGSHQVTAIVDDVNRFPEESEENNILTKQVDFGLPSQQLADTIILDVSLGAGRFSEGDLVTFEAMVRNIGSATTENVVGVAFLIDDQYITFGTGPALAPDETRNIRSVSSWQAVAGQHRLLVIVDDVNRFPEISESNNRFELEFHVFQRAEVQLPDSTLDSLSYETDAAGQVILKATVSNTGTVPTPDLVGVAFFVDGQYATFGTTGPMDAGATATIEAVQALPLEGTHRVMAIVDDVNRYDEISHQNNVLEQEISFFFQAVERRAIWVTRYDWTSLNQAPRPAKIDEIVTRVAEAGFNTIFFQVRGAGDAYYKPGLEPWAARLTGSLAETLGQDPGWDPLATMLAKAHAAGLELHAYVNVYPVWLPPPEGYGQLWPPATTPPHLFDRLTYGPDHAEHPGEHSLGMAWRQHEAPDKPMSLERNKYVWASPGVDQVQDHILAVITDLVSRYNVDGLHLDLVRYAGRNTSYDPGSNAAAGSEPSPARDQWQRDRISELVRRVKTQLATIRAGVWLSAAVWPYYVDKWDWGVSEGYTDYYQDSLGWLAAGSADAIAPMLYTGVSDEFDRWQILMKDFLANSHGGQIYPGIGANYDDFNAIARRIEAARQAGAPGHVIFSYGALNSRNYWPDLAAGPYAEPATVPAHNNESRLVLSNPSGLQGG